MSSNKILTSFVYLLLRIAILIFIIPFFYEIGKNPGFQFDFWNDFIRIILLITFIGFGIIILVISNSKFNLFGFTIVFLASIYKIITSIFEFGFNLDLPIYFLLMVVSFYFMTKTQRKKKRSYSTF
ncbi:MAG: hypothetical protein K8R58_15620 [Bacteroidales bacterium]|nr:hypothetical protein [Bacteroidales bacterium]